MGNPLNLPLIPQQWRPVLVALIQIIRTKHSQLEFLSKERKLLEGRINMQHQLWSQHVASFRDVIVGNQQEYKKLKSRLLLEAARFDLVVGMKEKDALLYKLKLECMERELEDIKMCTKLHNRHSKKSMHTENIAVTEGAQHEMRKLKHEYEKLACQKNSEVSALLSERDFVWNQLKRMEDEYIILLKGKCKELESAHAHINNLECEMEKLQSVTNEKDTTIANSKVDIIERDDEVGLLSHKLSELSKDLETINATRNSSAAPLDDHNFDTQEDEFHQIENCANKQPGRMKDAVKRQDADVGSMDDVLVKLKEMSKEMEIKIIENENLRLLCSELEYQLNKQKNNLKKGCAPKEVSRNLIEELKTAMGKEGDGESFCKIRYQQEKVLNKVESPNGHPLVGSQSPPEKIKREGTKVSKGSHSLSKKRTRSESKMERPSLFSSAFKIPRLKVSHSVFV